MPGLEAESAGEMASLVVIAKSVASGAADNHDVLWPSALLQSLLYVRVFPNVVYGRGTHTLVSSIIKGYCPIKVSVQIGHCLIPYCSQFGESDSFPCLTKGKPGLLSVWSQAPSFYSRRASPFKWPAGRLRPGYGAQLTYSIPFGVVRVAAIAWRSPLLAEPINQNVMHTAMSFPESPTKWRIGLLHSEPQVLFASDRRWNKCVGCEKCFSNSVCDSRSFLQ